MKHFYLFLFFALIQHSILAQCEFNAPICEQAIPVGNPSTTGLLPSINNTGEIPGCGGGWSFHNTVWLELEPLTTTLELQLDLRNCANATGVQYGFYSTCDPFAAPVYVQCVCVNTPTSFVATGLIPEEKYYFMIDGCSGDICEFSLNVLQGAIKPLGGPFGTVDPPVPSDSIVCPLDIVTFTTNIVGSGQDTYNWSFPNGVFPLSINCNTATVVWGGDSGFAVVSVQSINDPNLVTSDSTFINLSPNHDTLVNGTYCFPDELGYRIEFGSGGLIDSTIFLPFGSYTYTYPSNVGCDSVVNYNITDNVQYESAFICPGESIEILGKTYSEPIFNDLVNLGIPSSLGCDSVALVSVYQLLMDTDIQVTNNEINCLNPLAQLSAETYITSTYNWTTAGGNIMVGANTNTIIVDQPGTYYLEMMRDTLFESTIRSCTIIDSVVITADFESPIISLDITNESCDGLDDGAVNVVVSNPGIGPFSYEWSDPNLPNDANIPSLSPGSYEVTVTAVNGCSVTTSFEIVASFDLSLSATPSDCDTLTGTATATIAGGSTNFLFEWSNGQMGSMITGLEPGGYSVTATDQSSNCRTHRNIIIEYDSSCVSFISGYVFNDDVLLNCTPPLPGLANMMIFLDNGQATATDSTGYYEFEVEPGLYTVSVVYNTNFIPVCANPIQVDASAPDVYTDNNFFLKFNPNNDLKLKVVKPNPRPGFARNVRVCLMNVGANPLSGTLTFVHDEMQEFVSSNPSETNYDATTRTVSWEFTDIPPGAVWIYYPRMRTPLSVPVGETIDYYFKAEPIQGDVTPLNNEWACSLLTTNAYDPNDKQVTPPGEGPEGFITREDSLLSYLVRFQNTGTDTAYTVVIRDTLDPLLNIASLEPGPASHPYRLNVEKSNVLEFTFDNIYLPDSTTDLEGSNGFVIFDIQVRQGIEEGDQIRNKAAIYFDYNPPIITNEVVNTLETPVGVSQPIGTELQARLYPNPSTADGTLVMQLAEAGQYKVQILDIWGRHLKTIRPLQSFVAGTQVIPLEMQAAIPGIYLLSIQNAQEEIKTLRWVKLE